MREVFSKMENENESESNKSTCSKGGRKRRGDQESLNLCAFNGCITDIFLQIFIKAKAGRCQYPAKSIFLISF